MDFVKGLGDTYGTPEVAVDGIGRVEVCHDRIRVTLIRSSNHDGTQDSQPAVCVIWTVAAWRACANEFALMHQIVAEGRDPTILDTVLMAALHH
jgi:hypothetical protein